MRKPSHTPIFSGAAYDVQAPILLLVGNDCAVGKMTVALEFARAARDAGKHAAFVPTGQTGIMIAGWGVSIDRVIADFAPGATEQLVLQAAKENPDMIVVEGQGSLFHRSFAPSTFALLDAARPQYLVLCHRLGERTHAGFLQALPSVEGAVTAYQRLADALQMPTTLLLTSTSPVPGSKKTLPNEMSR